MLPEKIKIIMLITNVSEKIVIMLGINLYNKYESSADVSQNIKDDGARAMVWSSKASGLLVLT